MYQNERARKGSIICASVLRAEGDGAIKEKPLGSKAIIFSSPTHILYTFFGPLWCQNNTTKTLGTPAKIRWRKEQSLEHPGAASGWEKLQQQTSDNLLSGKQLLFCLTRVVTAGEMLQQESPLLRGHHLFCFTGKA